MSATATHHTLLNAQNAIEQHMVQRLGQHRFWQVCTNAAQADPNAPQAKQLYDTLTGLLFPQKTDTKFIEGETIPRFAWIIDAQGQRLNIVLDTASKLLWSNAQSGTDVDSSAAKQLTKDLETEGFKHWELPNHGHLKGFATATGNPYQTHSSKFRLNTINGGAACYWQLSGDARVDVDQHNWSKSDGPGRVMAMNVVWHRLEWQDILSKLAASNLGLHFDVDGKQLLPHAAWQNCTHEQLFTHLHTQDLYLLNGDGTMINPRLENNLPAYFAEQDYIACRLPKVLKAEWADPEKGLWELWGVDAATLKDMGAVARDPYADIQNRAVGIDFGTSGTVVAVHTRSGGRELLRIGVRDFYEAIKAEHFENPTVLECLDYTQFISEWTATAYRPNLNWDWMRAAHEAQSTFRDNTGDMQLLASCLPRIKQWALRSEERRRQRLTDRQGQEQLIPTHTERNPVRGQALSVHADAPFDPVEAYAWYLGMAINWRGRGLFLKYYLSFPVKYPLDVKNRILASFRRGLQRSLPASLIEQHPEVLNRFEVQGLASEPAAYAAAALPQLNIAPSEEGTPYAVFDFGGGTSDFDFGVLRWATEEEEDKDGYERVFEHLASSGDNFLGGENLLEQMVYQTFKDNLEELRGNRIQFTQPLDAQSFPGCEAFLSNTQAAQTNTVMLAAKLRPFMEASAEDIERGIGKLEPQIQLDLIDQNNEKKNCTIALNYDDLDVLLLVRCRRGVEAFLQELAKVQTHYPQGQTIHVLLAGNGSRSRHLQALFGQANTALTQSEADPEGHDSPEQATENLWDEMLRVAFGEQVPDLKIHLPLPMDDTQPHRPTAKTGVALGLLALAPGERVHTINRVHEANQGQAPFAWHVGKLRRGGFQVVLDPSSAYGQWQELGPLQQGVFNLYASNSPRAKTGMQEGDTELRKHHLECHAAEDGARLFVRAVKPHVLEYVAALDVGSIDTASCPSVELPLE